MTGVAREMKAFEHGGRAGAVAFAINDLLYVGLGELSDEFGGKRFYRDFYEFNPHEGLEGDWRRV